VLVMQAGTVQFATPPLLVLPSKVEVAELKIAT